MVCRRHELANRYRLGDTARLQGIEVKMISASTRLDMNAFATEII